LLDVFAFAKTGQHDDADGGWRGKFCQQRRDLGGIGTAVFIRVGEDGDGAPGERRPVGQLRGFRAVGAGRDLSQAKSGGEVGAFFAFEQHDDGIARRGEDGRKAV
jgi:hypothetical protein